MIHVFEKQVVPVKYSITSAIWTYKNKTQWDVLLRERNQQKGAVMLPDTRAVSYNSGLYLFSTTPKSLFILCQSIPPIPVIEKLL